MAGVKVKVEHGKVGPAHNAHNRATYEAQVGHQHLRLVLCGISGASLEIDGVLQSPLITKAKPIEEFERLTGRNLDDIEVEHAVGYLT